MIGKLQGFLDYTGEDYIILMCGGVGYKVFVPANLRATGHEQQATLWIETIVREDSIRLFGFASAAQQDLFNKLTSVSGVGPKVAMAILGAFNEDALLTALATNDSKTLTAAPGVGKKVAEKICLELKGKVIMGKWTKGQMDTSPSDNSSSLYNDLMSALESLGYRRGDVLETVQKLIREYAGYSIEKLVPLALKEITNK
ncbi:MAG: Holliday junction branch migration protein RuvA [Rickettsiales bacterium]|jgi:Holliday junction DNA helicase RuvA|nr:Holliday junction branch migration protein RuvA [Rickettsiales bacterium]